jgi:hypothetical protein
LALGPGNAVALAIAGDLQRIDCIDLVAGGDERLHPRATLGFDPYHDVRLVDAAKMMAEHRVQPGDTRDALGKFRPSQHLAGLGLQFDIVMIFGPVVSD